MKKTSIILTIAVFVLIFSPFNFTEASSIANGVKGKILLQIEKNGEAWYVNPENEKRYYMGRPDDAFSLMRSLGVGISNTDLEKIQIGDTNFSRLDSDSDGLSDLIEDSIGTDSNNPDTDGDGHSDKEEILNGYNPLGPGKLNIDKNFSSNQAGKILLQVEQNGEAWYVNPDNNKRYFLGRPADAFYVMRTLGLGISNKNLNQISIFSNGALSIELNNKTCTGEKIYSKFDIYRGENIVASITSKSCLSYEGEFIKVNDKYGYFSILPNGLGGYYLYGKYDNLYRINLNTNSIEKIFDKRIVTDLDISSDFNKVVYYNEDGKIIVTNLNDLTETEYKLPTEGNSQFGSFKFSPNGNNVAFAVGYGPTNERGEIYSLDLNNSSFSLLGETVYPAIEVEWGPNNNVIWKEKDFSN